MSSQEDQGTATPEEPLVEVAKAADNPPVEHEPHESVTGRANDTPIDEPKTPAEYAVPNSTLASRKAEAAMRDKELAERAAEAETREADAADGETKPARKASNTKAKK